MYFLIIPHLPSFQNTPFFLSLPQVSLKSYETQSSPSPQPKFWWKKRKALDVQYSIRRNISVPIYQDIIIAYIWLITTPRFLFECSSIAFKDIFFICPFMLTFMEHIMKPDPMIFIYHEGIVQLFAIHSCQVIISWKILAFNLCLTPCSRFFPHLRRRFVASSQDLFHAFRAGSYKIYIGYIVKYQILVPEKKRLVTKKDCL